MILAIKDFEVRLYWATLQVSPERNWFSQLIQSRIGNTWRRVTCKKVALILCRFLLAGSLQHHDTSGPAEHVNLALIVVCVVHDPHYM